MKNKNEKLSHNVCYDAHELYQKYYSRARLEMLDLSRITPRLTLGHIKTINSFCKCLNRRLQVLLAVEDWSRDLPVDIMYFIGNKSSNNDGSSIGVCSSYKTDFACDYYAQLHGRYFVIISGECFCASSIDDLALWFSRCQNLDIASLDIFYMP